MPVEDDSRRPPDPASEPVSAPSSPPSPSAVSSVGLPPVPPPAPHTVQSLARLSTLTLLLACLVMLLILPYVAERVQYALTRGYQQARAEVAKDLLAQLPEAEGRFAYVAMSVEPSVVGIETTQFVRRSITDEWSHLFGQPEFQTEGIGSGVIVDESGYIVTNYHVVAQAAQVVVKLSDGSRVRNARIVGFDELTDLAVLKIDAAGLVAAPWGDSDRLEVGDPVLAVGNPYGLARTVTAGIISAKERRAAVANLAHQDFLQTDAAVNPGNSGGPLVNLKGEVVGINTAIYGGRYQGISFAIPSRIVQEVYEQLITSGKIARGWLGVAMESLNDELAERLGLDQPQGALVIDVVRDSPAETAGIEPGDVIIEWNGREIKEISDLSLAVARTQIGYKATIVVIRGGGEHKLTVKVGERPLPLE